MSNKQDRLTIVGIEVPDNTKHSARGTRVRLNNGMYLGDVQDLSLNGNHGDMWTIDVTVRACITNQQVVELFGKIGNETTETADQTSNDHT